MVRVVKRHHRRMFGGRMEGKERILGVEVWLKLLERHKYQGSTLILGITKGGQASTGTST
jgi:hypothetical protein